MIALRPATPADEPFLAALFASTRDVPWPADTKAAFLAQQFRAQSAHYARHYAGAASDVVLVDGEPAGRLVVWRGERELRVVDVALLPHARGRGIATRLLGDLLAEADALGAAVTVHVEEGNPAARLYERLGFADTGGRSGPYRLLERPAQLKTAS